MITYIQIIYNFSTLLRCATVPRKIWSAVLLKDESHAFLSYCKMEALMSLLLENLWRFLGLLGKSFYDLFLTHLQTTAAASRREEASLREVSLMFLWSFLKVQKKKWAVRRKLAIYTFFSLFLSVTFEASSVSYIFHTQAATWWRRWQKDIGLHLLPA